jgi:hypothetical protein
VISKKHWSPVCDVSVQSVKPAGGLYPALWHLRAFALTVVCVHDDVTDGRIGDRIFPHLETRSQWNSRFAAGDVWLPLARAERFQTRSYRLHVRLHVAPRVSGRLSVTWGMRQVGGLPSDSCTWPMQSRRAISASLC